MNSRNINLWGSIITSSLTLMIFVAVLIVAFLSKDQRGLELLIGAAIANASTAVSFWLGSSSGSQRKDELLNPSPPSEGAK